MSCLSVSSCFRKQKNTTHLVELLMILISVWKQRTRAHLSRKIIPETSTHRKRLKFHPASHIFSYSMDIYFFLFLVSVVPVLSLWQSCSNCSEDMPVNGSCSWSGNGETTSNTFRTGRAKPINYFWMYQCSFFFLLILKSSFFHSEQDIESVSKGIFHSYLELMHLSRQL